MLYLDHAATTPMLPAASEALARGFAMWANPSSPHAAGRKARAALEDARERTKQALGWQGELIFTSGASEALAIALNRATADRQIVSAVEHDSVFRAAPDAEIAAVSKAGPDGGGGVIDPALLDEALTRPGRAVVAIQLTNPETGTCLLPSACNPAITAVHQAGGLVLCDASQMSPQQNLPDGVDMAVISAHKLGGPIGIGALLLRDFAMLEPGGGQERGYRSGTENLPGALALAAALEVRPSAWLTTPEHQSAFRNRLLRVGDVLNLGSQTRHILAPVSPEYSANALLIRLDSRGIAVSAGSACSSGSLKTSRVMAGFGVDPDIARRVIRVSIGWSTTAADLDMFAAAWEDIHA